MFSVSNMQQGAMKINIQSKIVSNLSPSHFEIYNESSKHNVPPGSETHFKLVIISNTFEGKSLIERHR
jgi:BolA protein